jgi:hypothetical protein
MLASTAPGKSKMEIVFAFFLLFDVKHLFRMFVRSPHRLVAWPHQCYGCAFGCLAARLADARVFFSVAVVSLPPPASAFRFRLKFTHIILMALFRLVPT